MFAALVVSFALLQALAFIPVAASAPGEGSCDKPGAGNEKKCETPAPTAPPPTPTPTEPPPTDVPPTDAPPGTPGPTATPDPPAPPPTPRPTQDPVPSSTPTGTPPASPTPSTLPSPSQSPLPTIPPTAPPSIEPTSTPVVTPPPMTEPPVVTLPPAPTEPPPTASPQPTAAVTQPPVPFDEPPTVAGPADHGPTEPLAPTETDDPHEDAFAFGAPGGRGPQGAILEALSDLDDLTVGVIAGARTAGDPQPEDEDVAHAFGLRVPLGASIGSLARTAGKAVQEFAFPLTLAIAVLLFLLFQGELDRKDPKLAYAPVDSTKDMVTFE